MAIGLLIADDHATVREGLQTLLRFAAAEIKVVAAATAAAAIELAQDETIHVALVDIEMPDGDGFQVLESIKRLRPELPVLLHSTHDSPEYIQRGRELGACGYLVKGVDTSFLADAVRGARRGEDLWRTLCAKRLVRRQVSMEGKPPAGSEPALQFPTSDKE
jgi:DNA-binding NarL/FixJ family response regulator